MAVQYDPIAKDESLNTTELSPRNIADVLAEELSGIASALTPAQLSSLSDVVISTPSNGQTLKYNSVTQKWENANDAGGHVIEEQDGTDMTQRANLQFVDAHLTDDSVNDRTEVENILDITSADYALATEDGFYNVTDESDEELTAADIAYDSNDSIKEKIDKVATVANEGITLETGWQSNGDTAFVAKKSEHFVDINISLERPNDRTLASGWTKFATVADPPSTTVTFVAHLFATGNVYMTSLRGTVVDDGGMYVTTSAAISNLVRLVCNLRYYID